MNYDQVILYYFSGTGNARNAAKWILQKAKEEGIQTHLFNIDRFENIEVPTIKGKALIGFCSPTHGFNVPPIMLKFLLRFPRMKNVDVFILNTRAGFKFGKLYLPGLSGVAQYLPALILKCKGFRIVGMQPVDLPSNWILLHPGLREEAVGLIYRRCKKIVDGFASKLLEGKRVYRVFLSLPFDLLVVPVACAYYFIGRFFLAKTLVATHACDNCNACVEQCPVEAIRATDSQPFWTYKCESCMRCVNICPHQAIETAHGFAGGVLVVFYLFLVPFFYVKLHEHGFLELDNHSPLGAWIAFAIESFFFLLTLFVSYRILHFLMKNRFVNRVIAYSSLTKYQFWRRYKAPGNIKNS